LGKDGVPSNGGWFVRVSSISEIEDLLNMVDSSRTRKGNVVESRLWWRSLVDRASPCVPIVDASVVSDTGGKWVPLRINKSYSSSKGDHISPR